MNHNKITTANQEISPDPFEQFRSWYEARLSLNLSVPNAMSLGTVSEKGAVSVRTVLLKEFNDTGFVFFTNYYSRKGKQLHSNPGAALLFYWPESEQQVRIEGSVVNVTEQESDMYFQSRPEESRISAWASDQSTVIPDRKYLDDRFNYYKNLFMNKRIEKPPHWGGYRLIPDWFEFWKEGKHRLHDRIAYTRKGTGWVIERLAP
jgi:pyridoxamine 5'-phosphate oxidase